jgi:hypothetical protein
MLPNVTRNGRKQQLGTIERQRRQRLVSGKSDQIIIVCESRREDRTENQMSYCNENLWPTNVSSFLLQSRDLSLLFWPIYQTYAIISGSALSSVNLNIIRATLWERVDSPTMAMKAMMAMMAMTIQFLCNIELYWKNKLRIELIVLPLIERSQRNVAFYQIISEMQNQMTSAFKAIIRSQKLCFS